MAYQKNQEDAPENNEPIDIKVSEIKSERNYKIYKNNQIKSKLLILSAMDFASSPEAAR